MPHIESRLKKAELTVSKSHPDEEDQMMFFVRMRDLDTPGPDEVKFHAENPDYRGKVYIVKFGRQNLGPMEEQAALPLRSD